jgi:nucleoid-associated protein YgaU
MITVSPFAPASRCPLLIAPDNQLEWSTRKPCLLPSNAGDKFHVTKDGDKLSLLAHKYYKDFRLWWVIYDNNLDTLVSHPMDVPAGVTLRIPAFEKVQMELTNGLS